MHKQGIMSPLLFCMLGEAGRELSSASHGLEVVKHKERVYAKQGALVHQVY